MKVNFSPLANLFNNCRAVNQAQNTNNTPINSGLAADTFVKSTENKQISSAFNLKDKYIPLKAEMTEYIIKSPELSLDKIKKITQKYCPNVNVDDMRNAPYGTNINYATFAYTHEPVRYEKKETGIGVTELPKTVYLNLSDSACKKDNNKRVIMLGSILHELTHVLQSSSDDRTSLFSVAQSFCDKTKNVEDALPTLKAFNPVFNYTELFMQKALAAAVPSIGSLPKEINKRTDIDACFMKKFKMNSNSFAKNVLNTAINAVTVPGQEIDKKAVLDFTIVKCQHEAEAYQNSLDSNKEQLGISGKTDFDLRIELYNSVIRAAESLKE